MEKYGYRFSFGPWNIHEGADPFGPPVRPSRSFADKLGVYQELGFDAVQFHDDDAVPDLGERSPAQIREAARTVRAQLDDHGLVAEFVAPRLWEHPMTIDGAYTSNDPEARGYALERSKRAIDIAQELGTDLIVLWLAREGTYMREAKDPVRATGQLLEAIDAMLAYNPQIRIAIEPKPNEPMDLAYIPTMGHALALGFQASDPARVGVLMESAHSILAGLDPADEIAFAMACGKLWSVHLNDQNRFWEVGTVGLDVKAVRTQPAALATKHLRNSMWVFLRLVELVRSLDEDRVEELIAARDYEQLDWMILDHLMGRQ